jgi:hypothetical protein
VVRRLLGIDPGDVHCGVVELNRDDGSLLSQRTLAPDELVDWFELWASIASHSDQHVVVIESFSLYPGKMKVKAHDTLKVVEMIGVIKYASKRWGVRCETIRPADAARFFKERPELPELKTRHEVSAWKVAEWWRLFRDGK